MLEIISRTEPINAAESKLRSVADLLARLGDISSERVRLQPPPGTATLEDLIHANDCEGGPICEWIEGTLVEKAMGQYESWLAFIIAGQFDRYLELTDLGMVLGEAGVLRILPKIGRAGDVTFIAWKSLPESKPPARSNAVPEVVPDVVVEVLSASNTVNEMARKRDEYFRAGVKRVWEIDPKTKSAKDYSSATVMTPIATDGVLDGGEVLPGFQLSLKYIFDRAERVRGST